MDDQFMHELLQYIEAGNYLNTACHAMGIDESTYHKWITDGKQLAVAIESANNTDELKEVLMDGGMVMGYSPLQCRCYVFFQYATKASARSEAFAVAMVRKHMPDQWTAAMTFLERRFPGRWKRKEQIDIGEADSSTGIDETLLLKDPEAVRLVHDALEHASKGAIESSAEEIVDEDDKHPSVTKGTEVVQRVQDDESPRA